MAAHGSGGPSTDRHADDGAMAIRAAAVIYILLGLGFGAGTVVTLDHLARTGELPMTPFGFRSLSGPFEQLGQDAFTVLGWSLVGICALDVLGGVWLFQRRRCGALLGLATTPFALGLGVGFALPFLLIGAPLSAGLVIAGRRSLG
jgi:hypothetical protein